MSNRDFFAQLCASEYPRFLGVLKGTPGDQLAYRPHPRSRSAQELVAHLIAHEADLVELAQTGIVNHRMQMPFQTMDDAVKIYTDVHASLERELAAVDDGAWESLGRFLVNGNVIMEAPRRDIAWMLLLDAIHHRGQLSTYLRPMGAPVPSIYGPSADTTMAKA
jgi:uncharacterized damage-inducible protein DinB